MKWIKVSDVRAGSVDPPDQGQVVATACEAVLAANDNGPGGRRISLRCFQSIPILMGEIAVVDRLLQELSIADNDNSRVS